MNSSRHTIHKMIAITAMAMSIPLAAQAMPDQAHGQHGDHHTEHHGKMHHHGMGMLKQLDLTEEQKTQVKAILDKQRGTMKNAMSERRTHREEVRTLVEAPEFDRAKAAALIKKQQARELDAKLDMLQTQHDIYKVLTPEQREKARTLRAEYRPKK